MRCPKHKVSQPAGPGHGGQTGGSPVMWSQHRAVGALGRRYFLSVKRNA